MNPTPEAFSISPTNRFNSRMDASPTQASWLPAIFSRTISPGIGVCIIGHLLIQGGQAFL
jgi:hypothetical protein